MSLKTIAERINQEGVCLTETETLMPIMKQQWRDIRYVLTEAKIANEEEMRKMLRFAIAVACQKSFEVGLAAGKHQERQRRRAKA